MNTSIADGELPGVDPPAELVGHGPAGGDGPGDRVAGHADVLQVDGPAQVEQPAAERVKEQRQRDCTDHDASAAAQMCPPETVRAARIQSARIRP